MHPPDLATLSDSPTTFNYPGAKWWRIDFHTHTPASSDYAAHAGLQKDTLKKQSPENWLMQHMAWGLDAVVVTDHNTTAFIEPLQKAYKTMADSKTKPTGFRPLIIFPGFELTANGGMHILAVFDPTADLVVVGGAINECAYRGDRGKSDTVAEKTFEQCIPIIRNNKGLVIAAHIDECCGLLWREAPLNGRNVRTLMRKVGLSHADAIKRLIADGQVAANVDTYSPTIDSTFEKVLEQGVDAIEVRNWAGLSDIIKRHGILGRIARVAGSDSHLPDNIGRHGFSIVHMTEPNLEGLRMAFADGASRGSSDNNSWSIHHIPASDVTDWNRWPTHAVESISITKTKLAGRARPLEIKFHPRLNVIVGSRGSGKSTILHCLRLATCRGRDAEFPRFENGAPVRESPAGDFWRWAKMYDTNDGDGVILPETKIEVQYRAPAQGAILEWAASMLGRQNSYSLDVPLVKVGPVGELLDQDGGTYAASRFPLSIYSQKQVLDMIRGSVGLMGIIDRESKVATLQDALEKARSTYTSTRSKIREHELTLSTAAPDSATLKDITAELDKIRSLEVKVHEARKAEARALMPDIASTPGYDEILAEIRRSADSLRLPDVPPEISLSKDTDTQAAVMIYRTCQTEVSALLEQITDACAAVHPRLIQLDSSLRGSSWWTKVEAAKAAYSTILGTTNPGLEPKRIEKLTHEKGQLEAKISKHELTREEIARLSAIASAQLKKIHDAREAVSQAREEFVNQHNQKGSLLKISVIRWGAELPAVERSLRDALNVSDRFREAISSTEDGRENSLLKIYARTENRIMATEQLRNRLLKLLDSEVGEAGFGDLQNNLRKQVITTGSRREVIETWFPDDRLELEYRRRETSKWISISQGSIGQQTAAVLSFLFSFGDEPLILDQPEDDLDTRMIVDLIVEQVRREKMSRQIIIVTHNPNIVVHGDAELVHAMEDKDGQVSRLSSASGGLQQPDTRTFICDVMEGGAVAFRKRFERMGKVGIGP